MASPERQLSTHAIDRYRQRVTRGAVEDDIQAVLDAGRLQHHRPGTVERTAASFTDDTVAWVVCHDAIFPMVKRPGGLLVAVTTLPRPKRPKADRRAWRRDRREERAWAA